jgi:hypothetical protein
MAEYPDIASQLKSQLEAAFQKPNPDPLTELNAGTSDSDVVLATCSFVVLHICWVTRYDAMRRVSKVTVWKDIAHWSGVFEAHIHIASDKRSRRGVYANLTPSDFTAIVKISPSSARQDGTFSSEILDWSIDSKPFSAVDGKFKTDGKSRFELRPNPLRTFRQDYQYNYEYEDPDTAQVLT